MNQAITPDPASARSGTTGRTVQIQVSAEHWQFFAFVFAALAMLVFGVLDSLSSRISPACSVVVKVIVFVVLGYFTLRCWPVKRFLIRRLTGIKTETR